MEIEEFTELRGMKCERCGATWAALVAGTLCLDCKADDLLGKLDNEALQKLDELIFARDILGGIKHACGQLRISLSLGLEVFTRRYDILRDIAPKQFQLPSEKYWRGFVS